MYTNLSRLFVIISLTLSTATYTTNHVLHNLCDTPACQFVYLRFYHITRLDHTLSLFKQIDHKKKGHQQLIDAATTFFIVPQLEHPCIIQMMEAITITRSLTPLYGVWDDIMYYKYIHETHFIQDFIKCILTISKNLVLPFTPKDRQTIFDYIFTKSIHNQSTETLLTTLDLFIDEYQTYNSQGTSLISSDELQTYLFKGFPNEVSLNENYTERVSQRLYCNRRITKASEQLIALITSQKTDAGTLEEIYNDIGAIHFKHQRMIDLQQHIHCERSLAGITRIWKECQQFRYINEPQFIREYTTLVYALLRIMHTEPNRDNLSHTTIASLYAEIDELPLEQILHATDLLIEQMPSIIDHYEFNTDMSWRAWLRKYWWAPPTLAVSLALRIYLVIKLKNYIQEQMAASAQKSKDLPQPAVHQNQ